VQQSAILIPTPGQSEQVYLGEHLKTHPLFTVIEQKAVASKLEDVLKEVLD